ncbi:MAG: guanitoxin biosynthesis MATE family efflux transporter GntT [Cyanobacteriota bacterium]|nr:guanitoxin biosynthesis MATE family efflux transporter GntT [Cyanobacteriota bacterium]
MSLVFFQKYTSFFPRFYKLAIVSLISNIMVPLAGLCDVAFLGHLKDIRYLASVIIASILFDYLYGCLKFIRNSTNAMTAQEVGKEDDRGVLLTLFRSGLISLAIAVGILCLQYPIQKIGFGLLAVSLDVKALGIEYFNARIWDAPAVLVNFVLIGWFLGREMNLFVLAMSLLASGSNVILDYLMIFQWGWGSMGVGLATAISQYLALLVGIVGVALTVRWQDVPPALQAMWDKQALKFTLILKGNIMVRLLTRVSAYAIFTNISAQISTNVLAENGLLLQIVLIGQFAIQGIGMTIQTLVGNFQGKGETDKLLSVMLLGIVNSLAISSSLAFAVLWFPKTVLKLLSSHGEINQVIAQHTLWLLPLLICSAIAFMLEGYFIALKIGSALRNSSLIAFFGIFSPFAFSAWYLKNVNLLWASLTLYMAAMMVVLGLDLYKMQSKELKVRLGLRETPT